MRATVHQTLTSEAAAVLRNAVGLARRRGHAQVTPLHVAATLLASETSLLRHACLHSHGSAAAGGGVPPLQWRALEVCFNVALNRLPAAVHQGQPSLSNALIAALKRAQAHQRRGCIEQQQAQPLLGVKVEMEQLVISILDDPSVSRVMREAGFYTTHVKNSVEDTLGSTNSATNLSSIIRYNSSEGITGTRRIPLPWSINQRQDYAKPPDVCLERRLNPPSGAAVDSLDMKSLVETLVSEKIRKNTIIVGDEPLYTKSIVRELMIRIQSGNVPDGLKSAQFIAPQIFSCVLSLDKDDVDRKVAELNRITSNCCNGRVIAYVGDLRWTVETGQGYYNNSTSYYSYSPVEHVIVEVGRMLASYGDKLCLVGTATHGTYMLCKMRQPCLESQWKLQPLNVSSGGLSLALQSSALRPKDAKVDLGEVCISNTLEFHKLKASTSDNDMEKLNCCSDYSANFELKTHFLDQNLRQQTSNKVPCWLRQYKEVETCTVDPASPHEALRSSEMVGDLREKWDQNCGLLYEQQQQDIHFSCTSNMGDNGMLHDFKLQQQLDASKVCWNSTVTNPSWSNCSVMRSVSPQTSIGNSSKKFFEEESPSESDQNRSRLEVETTLTLGRSSSGDHDNNKILDKRYNRPSNDPLWSQSTANSPESLSASVGNVSFC